MSTNIRDMYIAMLRYNGAAFQDEDGLIAIVFVRGNYLYVQKFIIDEECGNIDRSGKLFAMLLHGD